MCSPSFATSACARAYHRWRELLLEKGYNGGQPITKEWFTEHLSGGHNPEAVAFLFPGISDADNAAIADDKEARFRTLAGAWAHSHLGNLRKGISAPGTSRMKTTESVELTDDLQVRVCNGGPELTGKRLCRRPGTAQHEQALQTVFILGHVQ